MGRVDAARRGFAEIWLLPTMVDRETDAPAREVKAPGRSRAPARKGGPILVGWREYVDLPEWKIRRILAKVDTGARSSAIDVSHVEELPGDRVLFDVIADRGGELERFPFEAPIARRTRVRSSFGTSEERVFVEVTVRLAGREFRTEVGLVDRENMLCRMLLGRKSLEKVFRVDPGRCYVHGKRRRKLRRRRLKT